MFALAVALGISHGETAVAFGIAAAPFVSLCVIPMALASREREPKEQRGPRASGSGRESTAFALSVAGIMLAEQALLNAPVITVELAVHDAVLAGIVFNVLLIARAPLQLFQAIQTSLLPHFTKLEAGKGHDDFHRLVIVLVGGIAGITIAVVLGLLILGPLVMSHLFGQHYDYGRFGLAAVGLGMGMHLAAGTLNQASLARGQAHLSAVAWLGVAVLFLVWTLVPIVNDALLRVEVGYAAATIVLCGLLFLLYRRGSKARSGHQGAVLAEQVR
jgi:O-antigen/teichoic acid export membrane protein